MLKREYLMFGEESVPVSSDHDYNVNMGDYGTANQTEAGSYIRDLVKSNIPSISVSMTVSDTWLTKLYTYNEARSITVTYYYGGSMYSALMYMQDLNVKRSADMTSRAFWDVSFSLHYLEDV